MIFEEIMSQNASNGAVRDVCEVFDPIFQLFDWDITDLDWDVYDIDDECEIHLTCIENLLKVAIIKDCFPVYVDMDDFDITVDINSGEAEILYKPIDLEDVEELTSVFDRFKDLTGLEIIITSDED